MSIEAMKQALEALEWNLPVVEDWGGEGALNLQHKAITALRQVLEQPQPEPGTAIQYAQGMPFFKPPPHRKPLSDVEIWNTYKNLWMFHPAEEPRLAGDVLKFARAIEAAHGIKE